MIDRVAFAVALIVLGLGMAGSEWTARAYAERAERQEHEYVLLRTAEMRSRLEGALNSTVFLAQGLVAYVLSVETPVEPGVTRALRALCESDPRIRNVGLAPDGQIRFLYPLEGNEKALGLRYEDHPDQWPSVRRAIETRHSVLAGPVKLLQGGVAVINRTPIFRDDRSYWGIISTVVDLDRLLEDVGILSDTGERIRYWLYGDNAGSATDTLIVGKRGESPDDRAIRMWIDVPGGRWELIAAPNEGWRSNAAEIQVFRVLLFALSALLAVFTYALLASRARARALAAQMGALNRELRATNEELHGLSRRDVLTRVHNRRAFQEAFEAAWRSCSRNRLPIAILLVDVDRFKSINDSYGHAAGDATLIEVAAAIQAQVRRGDDMVARYGGEEFVVMAVGLPAPGVAALAERIREAVGECRVQLPGETTSNHRITVSVGTAGCTPGPEDRAADLIEQADKALYRAKTEGRDRVCSAQGDG